jgi:hypothetical protein
LDEWQLSLQAIWDYSEDIHDENKIDTDNLCSSRVLVMAGQGICEAQAQRFEKPLPQSLHDPATGAGP